jgi:hypothetical protein
VCGFREAADFVLQDGCRDDYECWVFYVDSCWCFLGKCGFWSVYGTLGSPLRLCRGLIDCRVFGSEFLGPGLLCDRRSMLYEP